MLTKQFYSDHVAHAMQMYQIRPHGATRATIHDIDAAAGALCDMTPTDANIIIDVYQNGHFPEAVKQTARQYRVRDAYVWSLIDDFGRKFARLRGLI